MNLKSNFTSDLNKEKKLSLLLDSYYQSRLKQYSFKRISDLNRQYKGIDVLFQHKKNGTTFKIDEKAQLDYINENLPTFAFELSYFKDGKEKKGWLFNQNKKTDFYALITGIYADELNTYTSCNITLVNRKKLLNLLQSKSINNRSVSALISQMNKTHGKHRIPELNDRTEGYLFFSRQNKNEQPINLILRLSFLIDHKIAKKLV